MASCRLVFRIRIEWHGGSVRQPPTADRGTHSRPPTTGATTDGQKNIISRPTSTASSHSGVDDSRLCKRPPGPNTSPSPSPGLSLSLHSSRGGEACKYAGEQLIILSGYPSSGKTRRALQLVAYCNERADEECGRGAVSGRDDAASASGSGSKDGGDGQPATTTDGTPSAPPEPARKRKRRQIHHISDHTLGIPRSAYATARAEKDARAALYSAAKRALAARDDVVVLDALNYIKGFRYQLYCEAKNAGAACCVVHVGTSAAQAKAVNDARLVRCAAGGFQDGEAQGQELHGAESATSETRPEHEPAEGGAGPHDAYAPQVHAELLVRFEEPNALARWDRPLYTVVWDDAAAPWCRRVWDEVVLGGSGAGETRARRDVRPNQAAVLPPPTSSTHLHDLERTTSQIVAAIQAHQRARPDDPVVPIALSLAASTPQTQKQTQTQPGPLPEMKEKVEAEAETGAAGERKTETEGEEGAEAKEHEQAHVVAVHLPPTASVSFAQLQRLKRQFVALHRQQMGGMGMGAIGAGAGVAAAAAAGRGGRGDGGSGAVGDGALLGAGRAGELFVDYLNDWFGQQV